MAWLSHVLNYIQQILPDDSMSHGMCQREIASPQRTSHELVLAHQDKNVKVPTKHFAELHSQPLSDPARFRPPDAFVDEAHFEGLHNLVEGPLNPSPRKSVARRSQSCVNIPPRELGSPGFSSRECRYQQPRTKSVCLDTQGAGAITAASQLDIRPSSPCGSSLGCVECFSKGSCSKAGVCQICGHVNRRLVKEALKAPTTNGSQNPTFRPETHEEVQSEKSGQGLHGSYPKQALTVPTTDSKGTQDKECVEAFKVEPRATGALRRLMGSEDAERPIPATPSPERLQAPPAYCRITKHETPPALEHTSPLRELMNRAASDQSTIASRTPSLLSASWPSSSSSSGPSSSGSHLPDKSNTGVITPSKTPVVLNVKAIAYDVGDQTARQLGWSSPYRS
jgi:hypothetical protein